MKRPVNDTKEFSGPGTCVGDVSISLEITKAQKVSGVHVQ